MQNERATQKTPMSTFNFRTKCFKLGRFMIETQTNSKRTRITTQKGTEFNFNCLRMRAKASDVFSGLRFFRKGESLLLNILINKPKTMFLEDSRRI